MNKPTIKQSRIIAKEIIKFAYKYMASWEIEVKPTIAMTADDVRNSTQAVYDWIFDYEMRNIDCDDFVQDADKILDMLRHPEYVAGPLAEAMN